MYFNTVFSTGGYISGELKLALTLRILAGASYLDMFLWLNIDPDYAQSIFRTVCREWICNDRVIEINFYKNVLANEKKMTEIGHDFGIRSDGVFSGCIGALDG